MTLEVKRNEVAWKIYFGSLDMLEITGNEMEEKFIAHIKPRLQKVGCSDMHLPATAENIDHAIRFLIDNRRDIYNCGMTSVNLPQTEEDVIHFLELVKCSDSRVWSIEVSYFHNALFDQELIKDQLKPFDEISHDLVREIIEDLKGRGEQVKNFRPYKSDCTFNILRQKEDSLSVSVSRTYHLETKSGIEIIKHLRAKLDRLTVKEIKLKDNSVGFKITKRLDINLQGKNHG